MTKQVQYDQSIVDNSLANTFEMTNVVEDQPDLKNNQLEIKKSKRGGKRPGAGRKTGSTNKIQGVEFLEEYKKVHGTTLKEDLARDMMNARLRGDFEMLFKYQTAFAKYYFADTAKQEVDMTSNGQTLKAVFNFSSVELPDWK